MLNLSQSFGWLFLYCSVEKWYLTCLISKNSGSSILPTAPMSDIFQGFSHRKENQCLWAIIFYRRKEIIIKPVSKEELELLFKYGYLKHRNNQFIDKNGGNVGYYRTKGAARRVYLRDGLANIAKKLYCGELEETRDRKNG